MAYHHYRRFYIYTTLKGDRSLRIATVLLRKTGRWMALYAVEKVKGKKKNMLSNEEIRQMLKTAVEEFI